MRIISITMLRDFWNGGHAKAEAPLREWIKKTRAAEWDSPEMIRQTFPKTDGVRVRSGRTVYAFNIGGNDFRLVAAVHFNSGKVFTLRMMTHAEYSKNTWAKTL